MRNEPSLRLVGVDFDHETAESEAPASYSFLEWARRLQYDITSGPVDSIRFATAALEDVSRRIEDLARDLNIFTDDPNDTDRPRAA